MNDMKQLLDLALSDGHEHPAPLDGIDRAVARAKRTQTLRVSGLTAAGLGAAAVVTVAVVAANPSPQGSNGASAAVVGSPATPSASSVNDRPSPRAQPQGSDAALPASATIIVPPPHTAGCTAVENALATMPVPEGYLVTDDVAPSSLRWARGWVHAGGVPTSVTLTASCQPATAPTFRPNAPGDPTVTSVTVQGHAGWLITSLWGTYAAITWNPNATTQVTLDANGLHPAAFGNVTMARQKELRLSDAALLALAQTVPTS